MNTVYIVFADVSKNINGPLAVSLPGIPRQGEALFIGDVEYVVRWVTWRVVEMKTRCSGIGSAFILLESV